MALPWEEAALQPNFNLAHQFDTGLLIAKVARRQVTEYLYDLVGGLIANPGTYPAGAIFPFTIPQDANVPPRKILQHHRDREIWQVFAGINHPDARFYLNIPQNQRTKGLDNEQGYARVDFTSPFGWYFEGRNSDLDDPTDDGEFFVPAYDDLEIAVVNMANYEIRPQIRFVVNQLLLEPFDPTTERGAKMIVGILKEAIPCRFAHRQGYPYPMDPQQFVKLYGVPAVEWDGYCAKYADPKTGNVRVIFQG
jgi:hypothetical protein